jgi:GTP-binding protein
VVLAVVGRSNVGKSTLFNRLLGRRQAVVSLTPGTTRDRLYGTTQWGAESLTVIDTGGMVFGAADRLSAAVQRHLQQALEEATVILFVCDAQEGLVPMDEAIMESLRRLSKPVVLAVNKADHRPSVPPEFFRLGLSAVAVSALHGLGIGELLDEVMAVAAPRRRGDERTTHRPGGMVSEADAVGVSEAARRAPAERIAAPDTAAPSAAGGTAVAPAPDAVMTVALIGRQNVGKSSLFNALLGWERAIIHEQPGTTRDALEAELADGGLRYRLIDTAGLRHRRKVTQPVDTFAMSRTLEAVGRCDMVLMVLDATQGVTRDERRILARVVRAGCALAVAVNKWDLVPDGDAHAMPQRIRAQIPFAAFAPVLVVSARTGFQVVRILAVLRRMSRALRDGLPGDDCLAMVRAAWAARHPPRVAGRLIRLTAAAWRPGRPARVLLTTAPIGQLPQAYQRYLLNRLHADPRLVGLPVHLVILGPRRR